MSSMEEATMNGVKSGAKKAFNSAIKGAGTRYVSNSAVTAAGQRIAQEGGRRGAMVALNTSGLAAARAGATVAASGSAKVIAGAVGPAGWAAMGGEFVGGQIGQALGGTVGKEVGSAAGSVGTAATAGALVGGPVGAAAGALVGAVGYGISKGVEALFNLSNVQSTCQIAKSIHWYEKFELFFLENGKVAIRTCHGSWLCADSSGRLEQRPEVGAWEQFDFIALPGTSNCYGMTDDPQFAIRTHHGTYLSAPNKVGQRIDSASWIKDWEKWTIQYPKDRTNFLPTVASGSNAGKVALRTWHCTYLCANK